MIPAASLPIFFPTGSLGWLIVNFSWDIILGSGAFILLVYLIPRVQKRAAKYGPYPDKKGVIRERPVYARTFRYYAFLQIITLVVVLWGIFLTLVFSVGWKSPLSLQGLWFDLIYARANGEPNGAHILSWLSCAGFGLVVWAKTIPRPTKTFHDLLGDPFQGIAGLIFIGGIHELIWLPFYYTAYAQYLSWSILYEVLRDVSFAIMMVLFIATFWKYGSGYYSIQPYRTRNRLLWFKKGKFNEPPSPRIAPLSIFKTAIKVYAIYLVLWFVLPYLVMGHFLPITTLNNPKFGQGLYQETPWFSLWWVNAIETWGWEILCVPAMVAVWLYKSPTK